VCAGVVQPRGAGATGQWRLQTMVVSIGGGQATRGVHLLTNSHCPSFVCSPPDLLVDSDPLLNRCCRARKHERTVHDGVRPFQCPQCDQCFGETGNRCVGAPHPARARCLALLFAFASVTPPPVGRVARPARKQLTRGRGGARSPCLSFSPYPCTSRLPSPWPQEQARAQRPRAGAPLPLPRLHRAVCRPGWARAPRGRAPAAARVGGMSPHGPPRVAAGGWRGPRTAPACAPERGREGGRATVSGGCLTGTLFFFAPHPARASASSLDGGHADGVSGVPQGAPSVELVMFSSPGQSHRSCGVVGS